MLFPWVSCRAFGWAAFSHNYWPTENRNENSGMRLNILGFEGAGWLLDRIQCLAWPATSLQARTNDAQPVNPDGLTPSGPAAMRCVKCNGKLSTVRGEGAHD
jgi:hypothetical protein